MSYPISSSNEDDNMVEHYVITVPPELHRDTAELVASAAEAVAAKLAKAQAKYGYTDGWKDPNWVEGCKLDLHVHMAKGDPLDVMAYSMFLWHKGADTKLDFNSLIFDDSDLEAIIGG